MNFLHFLGVTLLSSLDCLVARHSLDARGLLYSHQDLQVYGVLENDARESAKHNQALSLQSVVSVGIAANVSRGSNPFDTAAAAVEGIQKTKQAAQDAKSNTEQAAENAIGNTQKKADDALRETANAVISGDVREVGNDMKRGWQNVSNEARHGAQETKRKAQHGVSDVRGTAAQASRNVTRSIVVIPGSLQPGEAIPDGGNSKLFINRFVVAIVILILAGALFGRVMKQYFPTCTHGYSSPIAIALLGISYALLLPGVLAPLFSFNLVVNVEKLDARIGMTTENGQSVPIVESLVELFFDLISTGGFFGAFLLLLYAVLVPLLKLAFLCLGEYWRQSTDAMLVRRARVCIQMVQMTSKWASPDLFAYILMLYMYLDLQDPPDVTVAAHLDVGFTCFVAFCVTSTCGALMVELPDEPKLSVNDDEVPQTPRAPTKNGLVASLMVAFASLLALGSFSPCMAMRLDEALVKSQIDAPLPLKPLATKLVDDLNLTDKIRSDASVARCLLMLLEVAWTTGAANSLLAFMALATLVVALPSLDMLLIFIAVRQLNSHGDNLQIQASDVPGARIVAWTHVLQHVAMLDVFVMGVIVMTMAGDAYKEQGVTFALGPGIWMLFAAEFCHYTAAAVVRSRIQGQISAKRCAALNSSVRDSTS